MNTPADPRPPLEPPVDGPHRPNFLDNLDRSLDPEADDRRTMERLKHPVIKAVVFSLIALLFCIFGVYAAATLLRIPIQEPEIIKTFIDAVVNIMKIFVP